MKENEPISRLASSCIMVGLSGPEMTAEEVRRIRWLDPAGLILFARNLDRVDDLRELLRGFSTEVSRPPLLAIDQEGGRVSRLERWIGPTLPAERLATGEADGVEALGRATGAALSCLGFNLDFAPVADLSPVDAANGIGDRSFGTDPEQVTRMTRAFLEGLQGAGVAGCLKHFPGLGDTTVDSHATLPTGQRTLERLREQDMRPYRELGQLPASVMVGHGHYPALDGERPLPATLSRAVISGELRDRLGYRGVVVSDDMEMGAVADRDVNGAAAVQAIRAGCDLLLYCHELDRAERAVEALTRTAREDTALLERLRRSSTRVRATATRWSAQSPGDDGRWAACVESFAPFRPR